MKFFWIVVAAALVGGTAVAVGLYDWSAWWLVAGIWLACVPAWLAIASDGKSPPQPTEGSGDRNIAEETVPTELIER